MVQSFPSNLLTFFLNKYILIIFQIKTFLSYSHTFKKKYWNFIWNNECSLAALPLFFLVLEIVLYHWAMSLTPFFKVFMQGLASLLRVVLNLQSSYLNLQIR